MTTSTKTRTDVRNRKTRRNHLEHRVFPGELPNRPSIPRTTGRKFSSTGPYHTASQSNYCQTYTNTPTQRRCTHTRTKQRAAAGTTEFNRPSCRVALVELNQSFVTFGCQTRLSLLRSLSLQKDKRSSHERVLPKQERERESGREIAVSRTTTTTAASGAASEGNVFVLPDRTSVATRRVLEKF